VREHIEAILNEWQEFAASIPSAKEMNRAELRNDAQAMLLAIARDIDNSQSGEQQSQKSKGRQHRLDMSDTAAESHGLARFASGFDIKEMVSRISRASRQRNTVVGRARSGRRHRDAR
jgi:hypothetical protein